MLRPASLVFLMIVACGPGAQLEQTPGATARRVMTPWNGATLDIASTERVIPANATAVDVVATLVGPERIAALPETASTYSLLSTNPERWESIPRFGRYESETLLTLNPDFVLCDPWQDNTASDVLRDAGVPVMCSPGEATWPAIESYVRSVAQALDAVESGELLIARLEERRDRLATATVNVRGMTALTYSNGGTGGWTAGSNTSAETLITTAGLVNAATAQGIDGHQRVDFETLITWDPDIIIVASGKDGAPGPTAALLRSEPALASLTAVRLDRIVELPAALFNTVSHRLLDASEALAAAAASMFETTPPTPRSER